jgi:hypothetical protein
MTLAGKTMVADVSVLIAGYFPTTPISLNVAEDANKGVVAIAGPAKSAVK